MQEILTYLKDRGGFARMKDLRAASFQTRDIAALVQEGKIEKVKPGLYRLPNIAAPSNLNPGYIEVAHAVPRGIIALASALAHHELTTYVPSEIYVAIPMADKPPRLDYPPIRFFYFPERFYAAGVEEIKTASIPVRIYNKEKAICDMFRYRNTLGESLALEALRAYLKRRDVNVKKLMQLAVICRVKTVMTPYMKAMAG